MWGTDRGRYPLLGAFSCRKTPSLSHDASSFPHSGAQAQPPRRIRVIGVPLDLGASRRGVDMGPSAVRVAGLEARLEALGHQVTDGGNIRVEIAETQTSGKENAHYLKQIAETCTRTAEAVVKMLEEGDDAAGAGRGPLAGRRLGLRRGGVLSPQGREDRGDLDRCPLGHQHAGDFALRQRARDAAGRAAGTGAGAAGEDFRLRAQELPRRTRCWSGVRDIDAAERENIRRAGVAEVYTMRDIDERGMRAVMEEALRAAGRGTAGYHVSLDMDWIDPEDAPGVGTPVRGGATYREAHLAMEIIADHGRLLSFEIVEVNPVIDEHNRTADLAVELACSAFGKKIL